MGNSQPKKYPITPAETIKFGDSYTVYTPPPTPNQITKALDDYLVVTDPQISYVFSTNDQVFTAYTATPPPGYSRLGDIIKRGIIAYLGKGSTIEASGEDFTTCFIKSDSPLIKPPTRYELIWYGTDVYRLDCPPMWTDLSQCTRKYGAIFRPVPPVDYVSLGDVAYAFEGSPNTNITPPNGYSVCVHKSLVSKSQLVPEKIIDAFSGGNYSLQIYNTNQNNFFNIIQPVQVFPSTLPAPKVQNYVIMPPSLKKQCCVEGKMSTECGDFTYASTDEKGSCNTFLLNEYCPTDVENPSCKAMCSLKDTNCDTLYQSYCSTKNFSDPLLPQATKTTCGCFHSDSFYTNYYNTINEGLPQYLKNTLPNNKNCNFQDCVQSDVHTFGYKQVTPDCPSINLLSCIQNISFDNDGKVIGDLTLKTTNECVQFLPPTYSEFGNWSECKDGKQSRSRTCLTNCTKIDQSSLTEIKDCSAEPPVITPPSPSFSDWSACSEGKQTRTCLQNCGTNPSLETKVCSSYPKIMSMWSKCNNGLQTRHCIANCSPPEEPETRECVNPVYETNFSTCSKDCGGGTIIKKCLSYCGDGIVEEKVPDIVAECNTKECSLLTQNQILALEITAGVVVFSLILLIIRRAMKG